MTESTRKKTFSFQAEVKQLLHLMIHSLYSHKEIFLRELISNASDATDKLRFASLSNPNLIKKNDEFRILIKSSEKDNTVTITDNGIGMSYDEIVNHLGTIAQSGTQQFIESLTGDKTKDSKLIGKFGVGFYSIFMVAEKVVVVSRSASLKENQAVRWESKGDGEYSVENTFKTDRGTEITLHLKENEKSYSSSWQLRSIINKYSDHIDLPIMMEKTTNSDKEKKSETNELETVNQAKALWIKPKSDITDNEYQDFYKHISHDYGEPLLWIHNKVEGTIEYTSLLFVPKNAPFDLYDRDRKLGIKLYIQRVFIMENTDILPNYLRFIRGIIDSNDLPLNVSREILQKNKIIEKIKSASIKKILSTLEKMIKSQPEQYETFWNNFGKVLKEGIAEDTSNQETLVKLIRFSSTYNNTSKQDVSLKNYVSRMKDKQNKIYYVIAEGFSAAKNSPHLEVFRKKDIEVLLLSDRVDEWLMSNLTKFEEKYKFQSITKGSLDLDIFDDKQQKKEKEKQDKDFQSVLKQMKEILSNKIKEVRITHRLTDSPACVVADEDAMSMHLQRLMTSAGQSSLDKSQVILELNPKHLFIQALKDEQDEEKFSNWSHFLYEQAILAEGGHLEDPASFIKRINNFLSN